MSAEGPQMRMARDEGVKLIENSDVHLGINGKPLVKITCSAAELIPTVQYGNCSVGPIVVQRFVEDTGDDKNLKNEIRSTQSLCEEAVAEERQTVHALTRQSTEGRYQG